MRGAVGIMELILIVFVVVSLTAWAFPVISDIIKESLDIGEISAIEPQFKICSEKILETARTGTTNECVFSISKGEIRGTNESIEYSLESYANICDPHPEVIIDELGHIYQQCIESGGMKIYKLIWKFPLELQVEATGLAGHELQGGTPVGDIDFGGGTIQFRTLTVLVEFDYLEGQTGNTIELSRKSITEEKVIMGVRIY